MPPDCVFDIPPEGAILTWTFVGDLMISFSQSGVMPEARFEQYIGALESHRFGHILGLGRGGIRLTSIQRTLLAEHLRGKTIAVVIDSTMTRGIITALGWFGLKIKSFGWDHIGSAVRYLDVPGLEPADIVEISRTLSEQSIQMRANGTLDPVASF